MWGSPIGAVQGLSSFNMPAPHQRQSHTRTMPAAVGGDGLADHNKQHAHSTNTTAQQPPPPLSREQKITFLRLEEVLADIASTEAGAGKKWLNVQPCLSNASKLAIATLCEHEDRLTRVEVQLAEVQQAAAVLANDARLKEERHNAEQQQQAQQFTELKEFCHQLTEAVSQRDRENAELQEVVTDLYERVSALERETVEREARSLEAPVSEAPSSQMERDSLSLLQRLRGEHLDASRGGSSKGRGNDSTNSVSGGRRRPTDVEASVMQVTNLHERVLEEVAQLRSQWEEFLMRADASLTPASKQRQGRRTRADARALSDIRTPSSSSSSTASSRSTSALSYPPNRQEQRRHRGEELPLLAPFAMQSHFPFPPQRVRWFWTGDDSSHFSRAMRALPTSSPHGRHAARQREGLSVSFSDETAAAARLTGARGSPALPWDDARLHDTRSDCWYSAGVWPCELLSAGPLAQRHHHRGHCPRPGRPKGSDNEQGLDEAFWRAAAAWGCYVWERPSVIRIARPGVYRFTMSLLVTSPSGAIKSAEDGLGHRSSLHRAASPVCRVHGTSAGDGAARAPTLALYVDGSRVLTSSNGTAGVAGASGAPTTLLFVPSAADDGSLARCTCRNTRRSPQRRSRSNSVRPCCAPGQLAVYTVSEHCYLAEGSLLQVRCHNFHDTTATLEAFLELEFVV